jgi:D-arabinose 1-dehydrogenase-like Zn-dependent alcohol dehydrogenase
VLDTAACAAMLPRANQPCVRLATAHTVCLLFCRLGEKSIRLMRPSLFSTLASDPGLGRQLTQQLLDLVAAGVVQPQVHKVYPLSRAADAQADLAGRRTTGKVLLRPDYLVQGEGP